MLSQTTSILFYYFYVLHAHQPKYLRLSTICWNIWLSAVDLVASGTPHVSSEDERILIFWWTIPLANISVQLRIFLDFCVILEACFMTWTILQMFSDSLLAGVSPGNCDLVFQSRVPPRWAPRCCSAGAQTTLVTHARVRLLWNFHLRKKNSSLHQTRPKYFLLAVGPPIVYKWIYSP